MVGARVLLPPPLEHHELKPKDVGLQPLLVD